MTTITLIQVSKQLGRTIALNKIHCHINEGEFITIIGPSGSGKTTLLRIILGDLQPDTGQVFLDDTSMENVPINKRNIGFVPQDFGLFPHLSVSENIAYGLKIQNLPNPTIAKRVSELMQTIHLSGVEEKKPGQLSWGQQQRVARREPDPHRGVGDLHPQAPAGAQLGPDVRVSRREPGRRLVLGEQRQLEAGQLSGAHPGERAGRQADRTDQDRQRARLARPPDHQQLQLDGELLGPFTRIVDDKIRHSRTPSLQ